MTPDTNSSLGTWINSNNTIKLSSNAYAFFITCEGNNNFASLADFDKKIIESLPNTCKEKISTTTADPSSVITAEPDVPGANISPIEIHQLIVAVQGEKYYTLIVGTMNVTNMNYTHLLPNFNVEWDTHE